MKPIQRTALASVINLILLGMTDVQAADSQALEKRIRELEARLEKLDKLSAISNPSPLLAKPAVAPEVEKLSKKVNTLERKLEIQDEVSTSSLKSLPVFEAGPEGYKISSSNKEHQIKIGGSLQTDARFFIDNDKPNFINATSTPFDNLQQRQARILIDGYAFKDVNYRLQADFANANLLPDAYLDYTHDSAASFLVGKFRPGISLERLQGDSDTVFSERSWPSALAPNRDVGIQIHGGFTKPGYKAEKVAGAIDTKNTFTYQVGLTNGSGDAGNPTTAARDTDNNKEVHARLFAKPFEHSGYSWVEGLGLGLAGSFGDPKNQTLSPQATLSGLNTIVDYSATRQGTVTANGTAHRIYPQAYWYKGSAGLLGEYVFSNQTLLSSVARSKGIQQDNRAYQIQASYVVTGEDVTFSGVKPIQNFDPSKGK